MKKVSLYLKAALYIAAGINHFLHPDTYMKITPPWLPWPYAIVIVSGLIEIVLGLLVIHPRTRSFGAWSIVGLLIAVFPANIQMLLNYLHENNPRVWLAVLRLPLQFVLIRWAYRFTKPLVEKVQSDK